MESTGSLPGPADRLEFVDALRGFALLGVYWANLPIFAGITYMTDEQRTSLFPAPIDALAHTFEYFFIENKFIGLFSFLFGISFWLFLSRVGGRSASPTQLFYRRIFWLFVIGLVHGWILWCFDVLRFYALWAVPLPLLVRTPPRRLLALALCAAVLVPALVSGINTWNPPAEPAIDFDALALDAFSHGTFREMLVANWKYDWYLTNAVSQIGYQVAVFGRILLGLWVARTLDLGNLGAHRALFRRVLLVGIPVGVVGNTIFAGHVLSGTGSPAIAFARKVLIESGYLAFTLSYASALALAYLTVRGRGIVRVLAPLGKMALTWYLLATIAGIGMFYGFPPGPGLMGKVGPAKLTAIALTGYAIQVTLAQAWMRRFRFGPAEWLWRVLTYWKLQPMRASVPAAGR